MRWFFTLLLLTNLALAGWLYWQSEAPQAVPEQPKAPVQKQLQLLSELPQQSLQPIPHAVNTAEAPLPTGGTVSVPGTPSSEPSAAPEEVRTVEQAATCVRIAPLAKAADVESMTRRLAQENLTVLDSGEGEMERQTYWVMIPPYPSDKAARSAGEQLARAKVRDFLVERSGDFQNGISLGLFSQKEGAENRLQEILALNLNIRKPEIRLRTSSVRSHWLITRVNDDESLKSLQRQLDVDGLQGTTVECPP